MLALQAPARLAKPTETIAKEGARPLPSIPRNNEEQDYQDLQDAWALKVQEWENPYQLPNLDLGGQVDPRAGYTVNQQLEMEKGTEGFRQLETSTDILGIDPMTGLSPDNPSQDFLTNKTVNKEEQQYYDNIGAAQTQEEIDSIIQELEAFKPIPNMTTTSGDGIPMMISFDFYPDWMPKVINAAYRHKDALVKVEQAKKDAETVSQYIARIQSTGSISELNTIADEVYQLDPGSSLAYFSDQFAMPLGIGTDQVHEWQKDIFDAICDRSEEISGMGQNNFKESPGNLASEDDMHQVAPKAVLFDSLLTSSKFWNDMYNIKYQGQPFTWDNFQALEQQAFIFGGPQAVESINTSLNNDIANYMMGLEVTNQYAKDWLDQYGFLLGGKTYTFDFLSSQGSINNRMMYQPYNSTVGGYVDPGAARLQLGSRETSIGIFPSDRVPTGIGKTALNALELIDSGYLTRADQEYAVNMMIGISRDYWDAKGTNLDEYYEKNPDSTKKFTDLKALVDKRMQERQDESEAGRERSKKYMEELYDAVTSGNATDEQLQQMNLLMSVDIGDFKYSEPHYEKTYMELFDLCMNSSIEGGDAIPIISMFSYELDMRIAYALEMTMDEYYAFYPEREICAKDRFNNAVGIFKDLYQKQWEKALAESQSPLFISHSAIADRVCQEVYDIYLPEPLPVTEQGGPGIGFAAALGMGLEHGLNNNILNISNAIDFYIFMMDEEETKQEMRAGYDTPQEYREACESAIAAMLNPEEKKLWTERLDNVLNIFDLGLDPSRVGIVNFAYTKQKYLDSIESTVYEKGTRTDYGTFQATSTLTDTSLTLLEEFIINKGLGGKMLGKLVGNFSVNLVGSTEEGRLLHDEGNIPLQNTKWAAMGSAAFNAILDEAVDFKFMPDLPASKQGIIANALIANGYANIVNSKTGKVIQYIDKLIPKAYGVMAKSIEDGSKGLMLNAIDQIYYGTISGDFEGLDIGEMTEAFKGKAAESIIEYAGGKFFDYSGAGVDRSIKLNSQGQALVVLLMCYAQGTSTLSSAYNTSERIAASGLEPTVGDIIALVQSIEKDKKDPEIVRHNEELAKEAESMK